MLTHYLMNIDGVVAKSGMLGHTKSPESRQAPEGCAPTQVC